jgi:hypothetical protein
MDWTRLDRRGCDAPLGTSSLDQRIAGQSGLLSIMKTEADPQNAFLQTHCNRHSDRLIRIVLSAKMKSQARHMLDQSNATERALFLGLPDSALG